MTANDAIEGRHVQWPRFHNALANTPTRCAFEKKEPTAVGPLARGLGVVCGRCIQFGYVRDRSLHPAVRFRRVDHRGASDSPIAVGHISCRPAPLDGSCRIAAIRVCGGLGSPLFRRSVPCGFSEYRRFAVLDFCGRTRSCNSALDSSHESLLAGILSKA
jgi:hypothetical protein